MIILLSTFAALLLFGTPIAIAMIASSGLVIWMEGIPLTIVAQRVFAGLQSFPLLAVPLFTLAGSLMNESGISERLFAFTRALVGHIKGGLAQTAIIGNVFLSGISGSSVADTAATTRVHIRTAAPWTLPPTTPKRRTPVAATTRRLSTRGQTPRRGSGASPGRMGHPATTDPGR